MLAALSHPDIVRLIDAGADADGRPYLVIDLAGQSNHGLVRRAPAVNR